MANCGCKGSSCGCRLVAGRNARVSGSGDATRPYRIDALPLSLAVQDSSTVALTLDGSGASDDPWILTAELSPTALDSKWGMWSGTQAEYNALGTYDPTILYMIVAS